MTSYDNYQPLLEIGVCFKCCDGNEILAKRAFQHPTINDAIYVVEKITDLNDSSCVINDCEPNLFNRYKVTCIPKIMLDRYLQHNCVARWVLHKYPKDKYLVRIDEVHDVYEIFNMLVEIANKGMSQNDQN